MKLLHALTAALAVSACATTTISDLESEPPREIYQFRGDRSALAQCLIENLGRLGAPTQYNRSDGTMALSFTIENDTTALYIFRRETIEVRTISKIVPFRNGTLACIASSA